jgi:Tfp pilus assembly protein PilN
VKDTEASIAAIKRDIGRLSEMGVGIEWSRIFAELVHAKPRGLAISGVTYEVLNNVPQLELRGYAEDRDALSAFRKALSENDLFQTVEFPASAFLKDRDIDFTMRIMLRVPKKL